MKLKISELEHILRVHKQKHGDLEISFAYVDNKSIIYKDKFVEIGVDTNLKDIKLEIIVVDLDNI